MITLQQLLMSDSDLSGGTQTGKGTDGAQDFLSLLAGALSDATGKGKDAPLTLADLKPPAVNCRKWLRTPKGIPPCRQKLPTCSRASPR
ncbi:flagellar hook-length control protein [Enterobacter asburiae]|uniref:Flagellar hook-length control protein n=1 Tax=Enterobacter asburiae TaxID=61645 RepID=A0A376FKS6_ENTAS|nr:flagellar hook-length control protein [Enterobacter asburiae]